MPNLTGIISDFVAGDHLDIDRVISNVVPTQPLVKAWFTIKANKADPDTSALVQKVITTSDSAQGKITDDGLTDGQADVLFHLLPADTAQLSERICYYDIQVLSQFGAIYTAELGVIRARSGVTGSTS